MRLLRRIGAYTAAALILLPVAAALIAANLGLVILQALAWPLERLRGRCAAFVHAVRAGSSS